VVEVGYHRGGMLKYGIQVELTSTKKWVFIDISFPKAVESHIVLRLGY